MNRVSRHPVSYSDGQPPVFPDGSPRRNIQTTPADEKVSSNLHLAELLRLEVEAAQELLRATRNAEEEHGMALAILENALFRYNQSLQVDNTNHFGYRPALGRPPRQA